MSHMCPPLLWAPSPTDSFFPQICAPWNFCGIISRVSSVLSFSTKHFIFLTEHSISHLPIWKLAFLNRLHIPCSFTERAGGRGTVSSLASASSKALPLSLTCVVNICLLEIFPLWQYSSHHHHSWKTLAPIVACL